MASEAESQPEAPDEPTTLSYTEHATNEISKHRQEIDFGSVVGGMALAIGFLFLADPIRQSGAVGVLNHNLSPVFITLYVALSAGHYLGLSITGSNNNFIDGVVGMFLVFSIAVVYWSINTGMSGLPIALGGIFLGLVMAHHRGWVQENKYIDGVLKVFGRGVLPLGLAGSILAEIVLPLIMSTQIDEFLSSLDPLVQGGVLLLLSIVIYKSAEFIITLKKSD